MPEYNDEEVKKWTDQITAIQTSMKALTDKLEAMAPGNPQERKELKEQVSALQKQLKDTQEELAEWKKTSTDRHKKNQQDLTQQSLQDQKHQNNEKKEVTKDKDAAHVVRRARPDAWV